MLRSLSLLNVGPAKDMELSFKPRLNILTGDNGLGKSFLLDVAWWALTRHWPHDVNAKLASGYPARPTDIGEPAHINATLVPRHAASEPRIQTARYDRRREQWVSKVGRPLNPGLVLYAQADGGFSVWDPNKNYWKLAPEGAQRLPAYVFSANEVWDGLEVSIGGTQTVVSNGLVRDWASWIREKGNAADAMASILRHLAPTGEILQPGRLVRLSITDARDIPSLDTAYSHSVPVLHASSGVRRILGLAYILLWSWNEHVLAAEQLGEAPSSQITLLIDEVESHLHPRWQRTIIKSLLDVMSFLHATADLQIISATHSPLILVSAEPYFDVTKDAWFDFDLDKETGRVTVENRPFIRRGTAGSWLTSAAFDLASEGRSVEAEATIEEASALLKRLHDNGDADNGEVHRVDEHLRDVLPEMDRFWVRWSSAVDSLKSKG